MIGALIGIVIYAVTMIAEIVSRPCVARDVDHWAVSLFLLFSLAGLGIIVQLIITELVV